MAQNEKQRLNQELLDSLRTGKLALITLQFLVGGLVTMGGTLFATFAVNDFGRSLGVIHLSIGLIGLAGGFSALKWNPRSRAFLLGINVLTIAYSTLSESIVQIQSLLPSQSSLGSLIGTIIAISMSATILYLLITRTPSQSRTR